MKAIPHRPLIPSVSADPLSGCATQTTRPSLTPTQPPAPPLTSVTLLLTALDYAKKGDTATAISTFMAWWGQSENKDTATHYLQHLAMLYKGQPAENSITATLQKLGQAVP